MCPNSWQFPQKLEEFLVSKHFALKVLFEKNLTSGPKMLLGVGKEYYKPMFNLMPLSKYTPSFGAEAVLLCQTQHVLLISMTKGIWNCFLPWIKTIVIAHPLNTRILNLLVFHHRERSELSSPFLPCRTAETSTCWSGEHLIKICTHHSIKHKQLHVLTRVPVMIVCSHTFLWMQYGHLYWNVHTSCLLPSAVQPSSQSARDELSVWWCVLRLV